MLARFPTSVVLQNYMLRWGIFGVKSHTKLHTRWSRDSSVNCQSVSNCQHPCLRTRTKVSKYTEVGRGLWCLGFNIKAFIKFIRGWCCFFKTFNRSHEPVYQMLGFLSINWQAFTIKMTMSTYDYEKYFYLPLTQLSTHFIPWVCTLDDKDSCISVARPLQLNCKPIFLIAKSICT